MAGGPDERAQERMTKAVQDSAAEGRILKVLFFDEGGNPVGDWASKQIPENPFSGQMSGLQEPPYPLEQLLFLAESHPVHSAALEQKTVDVVGKDWEWTDEDKNESDEAARDELEAWFESLAPDDMDMREVIHAAWLDVETIGWGLVECVRDPAGVVQQMYHVPGHTVRAHRDGFRLLQRRDSRKVWFRRWGAPDVDGKPVEVDAKTGSRTRVADPANDLLVIKRPSQRSTWYGIPGYVSAIGWITLALAARDDNLMFFANRREPRWAIVLENMADDPGMEEQIRRAFTVDLRQPHRNVIIPITGPGKINFQKMTDNRVEGSFDKLSDRADKAVMIGHRVPADRLANSVVGPLGGNANEAANRVYKEGVVGPGQDLLSTRLNRFIALEYKKAETKTSTWKIGLQDLDIETDREELDLTVISFHGNLITMREARHKLRLGPLMRRVLDPETGEPTDVEEESLFNDMIFTELPGAAGQAGGPGKAPQGAGGLLHDSRELAALEQGVRTLYHSAREQHEEIRTLLTAAREEDVEAPPRDDE